MLVIIMEINHNHIEIMIVIKTYLAYVIKMPPQPTVMNNTLKSRKKEINKEINIHKSPTYRGNLNNDYLKLTRAKQRTH